MVLKKKTPPPLGGGGKFYSLNLAYGSGLNKTDLYPQLQ